MIVAAYKRLARKYHPDANCGAGDDGRMKRINAAYKILSNPESRAAYDSGRARSRAGRKRSGNAARASATPASPTSTTRRGVNSPRSDVSRPARGLTWGFGALISILVASFFSTAIRDGCASSRPKPNPSRRSSAPSTNSPPAPEIREIAIAHEIVWPNGTTGVCSDVVLRGRFTSADEARLRSHFYAASSAWRLGGRDATARPISSCSLVDRQVRGMCTRPLENTAAPSEEERLLVFSPALARGGPEWCPQAGGRWSAP